MENLAHTLLGLTLAKAGLERATPLATTTLILSSNMPDIDVLSRIRGGTLSYLTYHRGFTHGFVGITVLAAALALALVYIDRRFRLRQDPFRRPVRPFRIFFLACLGGLSHVFLDFTNSYGIRPLLPFSDRWFYGDLAFIVDPWVWLLLGAAGVWLTAKDPLRIAAWALVAVLTGSLVAMALTEPTPELPLAIPTTVRVVWFSGLAIIVIGALLGWGRAGERVARYALLALGIYYGGMWVAGQEARNQAAESLPVASARAPVTWPTPANPFVWQAVTSTEDLIYTRYVNLTGEDAEWREAARLDSKFVEALNQSPEARAFLSFARFAMATVQEREDGYAVALRDARFDLRMNVLLDQNLSIQSIDVRWF